METQCHSKDIYSIYVQDHTAPQHQRRVMQNLSVCHEGQKQGLASINSLNPYVCTLI